jgi:hypothetical protein
MEDLSFEDLPGCGPAGGNAAVVGEGEDSLSALAFEAGISIAADAECRGTPCQLARGIEDSAMRPASRAAIRSPMRPARPA